MFLRTTTNASGTLVQELKCDACGTAFSITGTRTVINRPCRLPSCPSYDEAVDLDLELSKGDVPLSSLDGKIVGMRQQPLNPDRTEFLQRSGQRRQPVVIVRRLDPSPPPVDEEKVIRSVVATCTGCGVPRTFPVDPPLQTAEEVVTWMKTKLTPCACGGATADLAMRLDPTEN